MPGRLWISTTTYGKSYLAAAWKARGELKDYERRGFGQFVYLTLCAHLESVLAMLLRRRFHSIKFMFKWESLPPIDYKVNEKTHSCDLKPVTDSLLGIIARLADETHNAPLNKLTESYNVVFASPLREVVGKDLHEDLLALTSLRNLFAHGRELFLEFDDPMIGQASLDANPIQKPALRLHAAGIIGDLNITGENHDQFHATFYSDAAILYFYHAVEKIEDRLLASMTFMPETNMFQVTKLPKLDS